MPMFIICGLEVAVYASNSEPPLESSHAEALNILFILLHLLDISIYFTTYFIYFILRLYQNNVQTLFFLDFISILFQFYFNFIVLYIIFFNCIVIFYFILHNVFYLFYYFISFY
jgi:hypothetical protein